MVSRDTLPEQPRAWTPLVRLRVVATMPRDTASNATLGRPKLSPFGIGCPSRIVELHFRVIIFVAPHFSGNFWGFHGSLSTTVRTHRILSRRIRGGMAGSLEVFDEERVRILLIGSEEEIEQALRLIDEQFRRLICACLRSQRLAAWMSSEDLADTWQDTLLGVFNAAKERRFDPDRPLFPWIFSIAKKRAIDGYRRKTIQEKAVLAVGDALKATRAGGVWLRLRDPERKEILAEVRKEIVSLPEKQRIVFQAFIDCYPETANMETLRLRVSEITRQEETLASVKRALQEGRRKVKEIFQARGHEVGK